MPGDAGEIADRIAAAGGTPLLVAVEDAHGTRVPGVVHLKDVVKEGMWNGSASCAAWASVR